MARWKDNPNEFAIEVIQSLWQEGEFHIDAFGGDYEEWQAECDALIAEVNATEVKPVTHAYWIIGGTNQSDRKLLNIMHCSNCKAYFKYHGKKDHVRYCYSCGAKMVK